MSWVEDGAEGKRDIKADQHRRDWLVLVTAPGRPGGITVLYFQASLGLDSSLCVFPRSADFNVILDALNRSIRMSARDQG